MKNKRSKRVHKKKCPPKINTPFIGIGVTLLLFSFTAYIILYGIVYKTPCANSKSCRNGIFEIIENGAIGMFQGHPVPVPTIKTIADTSRQSVLGSEDPSTKKHIYVDLSLQKIFTFEGKTKIFETWVSTGRWGRTPTGNFRIWSKLRSTRMSGGSGSDYYNLPNVPYVMYFYRDYGLHGAYWHNNFGYTMSHGCVNLRPVDAEVLFNWADGPSNGVMGTEVSVCDNFTEPDICIQKNPVQ